MQNSNDFDGFVKEMYQFMKKYFAILLACCLCLTAAFPAFAAETDTEELFEFLTEENPDYEEVTALEDEILQKLEDHLSSNGAKLPENLTPDYTQAYKVYTDTPILTHGYPQRVRSPRCSGRRNLLLGHSFPGYRRKKL